MALAGLSGALRQRGQGDRLHGDSPSAEVVRGQGVRGQPLWGDGVYGDSPFEATTLKPDGGCSGTAPSGTVHEWLWQGYQAR